MGSSATINSATFSIYVTSREETLAGQSVSLIATTPNSPTTLANADYAQFGSTKLASDLTIAGMTDNALNAWTLNADGLAAINKTGITKLGLVISAILGSEPVGTGIQKATVLAYFSGKGTTYRPVLVIDYTTSVDVPFTVTDTLVLTGSITAIRDVLFTVSDTLSLAEILEAITSKWTQLTKAVASYTGLSKNTSSYSSPTKNSASFSNPTKNSATYTNQSKNSASYSNQTKN